LKAAIFWLPVGRHSRTLAQAAELSVEEPRATTTATPRIGPPVVIALDSSTAAAVCAGLVVEARHDVKVRVHTGDLGISAREGRPVQPVAIRFETFVPGPLRSTKNIAESHPFF